MSRGQRPVVGVVVSALSLGLLAMSSAAHAQAPDPTVSVDRTGTAAGEEMLITGSGWPRGAVLIVELCGQGGLGGSTDCDVGRQRTAGVAMDGRFSTSLVAGLPPVPCPCVIKVTDQTSHTSATAPIAVQGIPTVPITGADAPRRRIEIRSLEITDGYSWTELFGGASPRTLEVTLANTGDVSIERPALTVVWGRGGRPTGFVDVPAVESMAPGSTRTVEVTLPRGALAFGRYTAVAEIQGVDGGSPSRVSTSTYPWGLLVLALVALQVVLVRLRNRLRRRIHQRAPVSTTEVVLALPTMADAGSGAVPLALPSWDILDLRDTADDVAASATLDLRERAREALSDEWLVALQDLDDDLPLEPLARRADTHPPVLDGLADEDEPLDQLLAEHDRMMSVLTVDLVESFGASTARVRDEVQLLQRQVQAALDHAANLSEAVFDAAVERSEQLRARALEHERDAAAARREASELLRVADATAEDLVAAAEAAAVRLLGAAIPEPVSLSRRSIAAPRVGSLESGDDAKDAARLGDEPARADRL